MRAVVKVLVSAAGLWVAIELLDGLRFEGDDPLMLLVIALVLGVVSSVVRPVLRLLSLPLVLLTLGLFLLVVNAAVFAIVVEISKALDLGLVSDGFGWTFLGAVVLSVVTWGLETFLGQR